MALIIEVIPKEPVQRDNIIPKDKRVSELEATISFTILLSRTWVSNGSIIRRLSNTFSWVIEVYLNRLRKKIKKGNMDNIK